jgi:hypothetical protein
MTRLSFPDHKTTSRLQNQVPVKPQNISIVFDQESNRKDKNTEIIANFNSNQYIKN